MCIIKTDAFMGVPLRPRPSMTLNVELIGCLILPTRQDEAPTLHSGPYKLAAKIPLQ